MAVTCDNSTTHFNTGCELLLHYDTDEDGVISAEEMLLALDEFMYDNSLTEEEIDFVGLAFDSGSISAICICNGDPCEGVLPDWKCEVDTNNENTGFKVDQTGCYNKEYDITMCPLPVDPCEDVTCEPFCDGFDYYTNKCVNGICVDTLVETNSVEHCGYVKPEEPKPTSITKLLLPIGLGIGLLQLVKK